MKYVYQVTWEDGCNCGYFSSKVKIAKFLIDFLEPEQASMVESLVVERHGVNKHSYKKFQIKQAHIGHGFIVVPNNE